MSVTEWLHPDRAPEERPPLSAMSSQTRELHEGIDRHIRSTGVAYLHPDEKTVQLDLLGSPKVIDWQEAKVAFLFEGSGCWSELPQLYGRYGTAAGRLLLAKLRELEGASSALACDSGMQATAIVFDVLMERGSHAVLFRQVYNKTAKYLSWLAERSSCELTIVDDGDFDALQAAIADNTRLVFAETYTNPLMRALDLERVPAIIAEARRRAPRIKLVVDSTIASTWGVWRPLLACGVDVVLFSGTKSFGGQDRDLGGFIATNDNDLANGAMDLLAMRGGILDWRRAEVFLEGLDAARVAHQRRCDNASKIASFLDAHPRVQEVFHPSLATHIDAEVIARDYQRHGSLMSFRLAAADAGADQEARALHFSDALASCLVVRCALSFDGLTTKVNHHKSVSEYFTPEEALRRNGIECLVRLGVGIEDPDDICAALNWALYTGMDLSPQDLADWRHERSQSLGLIPEGESGR